MAFREVLGFPSDYPFGVEIEVENKNVEDIDRMLKKQSDMKITTKDYNAILERFGKDFADLLAYKCKFVFKENEFSYWLYEHEDTNEFDSRLGAEVISPILYNQKEDLEHLKSVLLMLQENSSEVNENCGVHVHMGAKPFRGSYQKLLNFFLFYIVFEPVFYKLSAMGNFGHVREYALSYANPVGLQMKKGKINQAILENYIKENLNGFPKTNGLHFKEFKINKVSYGSSFEIRVFNGTLDPFVIENYINASLASVAYCVNDSFNQKEYQKRCLEAIQHRKDWVRFEKYVSCADSLVDEFVENVFTNQIDKDYFYLQYSGEYLKEIKRK